jgi:hypothetical protein
MEKVKQEVKQIFVVGNSRSGTTMMGRILGGHPSVFTFKELHFFEQLWKPRTNPHILATEEAKQLVARLFTIQRDGYYWQKNPRRFFQEAEDIIKKLSDQVTPPLVFAAFLAYESHRHGKSIPCDQTPRNIYYLQEILELYPQAYVVNMIRDTRDVLLSQKYRWRRRFLGGHFPLKEAFRGWSVYHPITLSMFWRSGIGAGDRFAGHPRVFALRFEDLLDAPEEHVHKLCAFMGLEFQLEMLQVPQVGSSHRPDRPEQLGVDFTVSGRWQHGGLSKTEIFICQKITKEGMERHGYALKPVNPHVLAFIFQGLMWLIKSGLSFLLNMNRTRNIAETIRRRLGK